MSTAEAAIKLREACNRPFRDLFVGHPEDLRTNKGHVGQLLELYIGMPLNSRRIDFVDGELKTNKTHPDGRPAETIFVTQICKMIDDLLVVPPVPYEQSELADKLENLLIVPVVKVGDCGSWYCQEVYHIPLVDYPGLRAQFRDDYYTICEGLRDRVEKGDRIGTTNGKYLQVRSKASKPYRPIHSSLFGRAVADKNHAFYLQACFVRDLRAARLR